jgi:murein L,D-transpeptidase YcbB/YkuD
MLPNADEVYLHDTPDVKLFDKCQRSFSSGCVRVADVVSLAAWVLQFQSTPWDRARIETQITSSETRSLVLDMPVPVFIVYFTSYVDEHGTLRFQPDLYERDAVIVSALQGAAP